MARKQKEYQGFPTRPQFMRAGLFILLLVTVNVRAEKISFQLEEGSPTNILLPWKCDDSYFKNPSDYSFGKSSEARVVNKVKIENTGSTPLNLWSLEVNGRDVLKDDGIVRWICGKHESSVWKMYSRWRDEKCHGGTLKSSEYSDPWGIINLWGVSLCGWDARAFASLATNKGIRSRGIPMNQHEVNEYWENGDWVVLDTDQDVFYPKLDGITPCSFEDLRNDPFLALRAKVFGRRSSWNPTAAWWNLSLFDFSTKPTFFAKPVGKIRKIMRLPYSLLAGEKVELDYQPNLVNPGREIGNPIAGWRGVNFHYNMLLRECADLGLNLPYPIKADKAATSLRFSPTNETTCSPEGFTEIEGWACVSSLPIFKAGENSVCLHALSKGGRASVTIDYSKEVSQRKPPNLPNLRLTSVEGGVPRIAVQSPGATQLWWQITPDAKFEIIPPNFDKWEEGIPDQVSVTNPIEQTFLTPGRPFYARAKSFVNGLWSDWSDPITFEVNKPDAPTGLGCTAGSKTGTALLSWSPCIGKVMIYGSNRADFVPEVYLGQCAETGILKGGGMAINWKQDKNLLAEIDGSKGSTIVPVYNFYRLIRSKENILSLPTSLIRPPTSLTMEKSLIFARSKSSGVEGECIAHPIDFQ